MKSKIHCDVFLSEWSLRRCIQFVQIHWAVWLSNVPFSVCIIIYRQKQVFKGLKPEPHFRPISSTWIDHAVWVLCVQLLWGSTGSVWYWHCYLYQFFVPFRGGGLHWIPVQKYMTVFLSASWWTCMLPPVWGCWEYSSCKHSHGCFRGCLFVSLRNRWVVRQSTIDTDLFSKQRWPLFSYQQHMNSPVAPYLSRHQVWWSAVPFVCCWIQFAAVLLRISPCMFMKNIGL